LLFTRTSVSLTPTSTFLFFHHPSTTDIYTLSLHDALPISMCEIAADSFTSSNTIIRSLENVENNFKVNCNWLPSHLSLDDFKSGKRFSSSGMSMCLINAVNHRIID